ncbi:MAG TPA: PEP-CTERM sorting domain-containing protein [Phycisphaerae bacterium]|nr:PEP-CTERM sorting domain-containing protein [Phycisphaerae bacterium]
MKLARYRVGRLLPGGTWAACAVLALGLLAATGRQATADEISVTDFSFDGNNTFQVSLDVLGLAGVTTVYRADLGAILSSIGGTITITHVAVVDGNSQYGSNGVFTGLDLDFVLFDYNGVLDGNEFGVIGSTLINAGDVRNAAGSPYQPTTLHPGPLFGTTVSGQLDANTAMLGVHDGYFVPGVSLLSVDTSHGWCTLGDRGHIITTIQGVTYSSGEAAGSGEDLFLLIGDVGMADEHLEVYVQLDVQASQEYIPLVLDLGGPYVILSEQTLVLNAGMTPMDQGIISWTWRIDGVEVPGAYKDGNDPWSAHVPFGYLFANHYDPNDPDHMVELEVLTGDGRSEDGTTGLFIATDVPEPAAVSLLSLAAAAILRRRRRRTI